MSNKSKQRDALIYPEATIIGVMLILISTLLLSVAKNTGWSWIGYVGIFVFLIGVLLCAYDWMPLTAMQRHPQNTKEQPHQKSHDEVD